MAEIIGPIVDLLLRRVRDEHALGTSRTQALLILGRSQQLLNAFTETVLVTETLATSARRLVYPIRLRLPLSAHIEKVRDEDRDLAEEKDWRQFANYSPAWFRTVAIQHSCFTTIGRDLLVVFPAKDHDSSVDVRSVKLTDMFADETATVEIPAPDINMLLDLGEFFLSLKGRKLQRAAELLKYIAQETQEAVRLDEDRDINPRSPTAQGQPAT